METLLLFIHPTQMYIFATFFIHAQKRKDVTTQNYNKQTNTQLFML